MLMKRTVGLVMLIVLVSSVFTGCVSKSAYNKAVRQSNTLSSQLAQAQTELAATQQNLTTLDTSVRAYQPYVDLAAAYLGLLSSVISASQPDEAAASRNFESALSATNDSSLQALWTTVRAKTGADRDAAQVPFLDLLMQRLAQSKPKTN